MNTQKQQVELLSNSLKSLLMLWSSPKGSTTLHNFGYFLDLDIANFKHEIMDASCQKNNNSNKMFGLKFMEHWFPCQFDEKVDGVKMNMQHFRMAMFFG